MPSRFRGKTGPKWRTAAGFTVSSFVFPAESRNDREAQFNFCALGQRSSDEEEIIPTLSLPVDSPNRSFHFSENFSFGGFFFVSFEL